MKLHDVVSKLKQAGLRAAEFQVHDRDRAGDYLLALALAVTATALLVAQMTGADHGLAPVDPGRFVYL